MHHLKACSTIILLFKWQLSATVLSTAQQWENSLNARTAYVLTGNQLHACLYLLQNLVNSADERCVFNSQVSRKEMYCYSKYGPRNFLHPLLAYRPTFVTFCTATLSVTLATCASQDPIQTVDIVFSITNVESALLWNFRHFKKTLRTYSYSTWTWTSQPLLHLRLRS